MNENATTGTVVVTGAAGFIGSALVRKLVAQGAQRVVSVDALSYAGDVARLSAVGGEPRHRFVEMDVRDQAALTVLFEAERPTTIYHLAAETHVDRSIDGPEAFLQSNTIGTMRLLEAARSYYSTASEGERAAFRFVDVSTDEVYGSLGDAGAFTEESPFDPRSPYSASKAAADHLASAYFHTFGLPVMITHASNNYGPFQFPEKLIPLALTRALAGASVPLYGDGSNVRDWLHVDDHADALVRVARRGVPGEVYLVGGGNERSNRDLLDTLLTALNDLAPTGGDYRDLITLVRDRPGHDFRYAVDSGKIERELGWQPSVPFEQGIRATVAWYLANTEWTDRVVDGRYRLERLGAGA
ncbi:MAG TPA: dTDP-glucose 4,6-dehydratase [Trueperaceae bacterium]|nr:dTDP-glucose 4,6-dehydratase [Trueperaceae bacterium]